MNDPLVWLEQHPGLAGYVQAVGSLLALVAAFLIPVWQRRSLEHAAELRLRDLVAQSFHALLGAHREFFPDYIRDPDVFELRDHEDPAPDPEKAVQELARVVEQLERILLFELKQQCRERVHNLKGVLLQAAAHGRGYIEDAVEARSFSEDDLEGYERSAYQIMLDIIDVAPAAGEKWFVRDLRRQIQLIDQETAARSAALVRVNMPRTLRSRIDRAWRSLKD